MTYGISPEYAKKLEIAGIHVIICKLAIINPDNRLSSQGPHGPNLSHQFGSNEKTVARQPRQIIFI
jgi:hypothetical protein